MTGCRAAHLYPQEGAGRCSGAAAAPAAEHSCPPRWDLGRPPRASRCAFPQQPPVWGAPGTSLRAEQVPAGLASRPGPPAGDLPLLGKNHGVHLGPGLQAERCPATLNSRVSKASEFWGDWTWRRVFKLVTRLKWGS